MEINIPETETTDRPSQWSISPKINIFKSVLNTVVSLTQDSNSMNDIFLLKLAHLHNVYTFSTNYSKTLINILKCITEPYNETLANTYSTEIKPYLKYFKDWTNCYTAINNEITKLTTQLPSKQVQNNITNSHSPITPTLNAREILDKHAEQVIGSNTSIITKFKNEILTKPEYLKYETINTKILDSNKHILKIRGKIERRRIKLIALFDKEYSKTFDKFNTKFNSNDFETELVGMTDFIIIEHEWINYINKWYTKCSLFINEIFSVVKENMSLIYEYYNLLKTGLDIFSDENEKLFHPDIMKTCLEWKTKYYNDITRESVVKRTSIFSFLSKAERRSFNDLLKEYQIVLQKYTYDNKNEVIYHNKNFDIGHYETFDDFADFLTALAPKEVEIDYNDWIKCVIECKRDIGVFKELFKECLIIATHQGHLMLFDNENNMNTDKDKSADNQMKSALIYKRKNVELKKKKSKGRYLMEMCEREGTRKNKTVCLDMGSEENMENMINSIGGWVEK